MLVFNDPIVPCDQFRFAATHTDLTIEVLYSIPFVPILPSLSNIDSTYLPTLSLNRTSSSQHNKHVSERWYVLSSRTHSNLTLLTYTLLADFPSSEAFDVINESLKSDDAERQNAIKQGNAVFAFKLKNTSGKESAWHIDLKEKGDVAKGEAPAGKKADGMNP